MTGDQHDMLSRLRGVLPTRWFPDQAPVLDGVLGGFASNWTWAHQFMEYVRAQVRLATASDVWLDVIAQDFFGDRLSRQPEQADAPFRVRIQRELFRERGTRNAITSVLHDLTGRVPIVFEPARPTDTGGYSSALGGGGGIGYGRAGGWGTLALPFQCFVNAYRPAGSGIASVCPWGGPAGGYGVGAIEYASLDMIQGQVTDDDIYAAVADVLPVAAIAWTRITN
ncbi:MAG: hypothetical protein WDN25_09260 [Acetobacteraceae bacterium]